VLDSKALAAAVRERYGRPGTPTLLWLLGMVREGAASVTERRLHRLLRRAGIGGWVAGAEIRDRSGRIIAEADVLFEQERMILEMDGFEAHSGKRSFVQDRRRLRALGNAGYQVLPVTWEDLDVPDPLLGEIRTAVRQRR